MDFDFLDRKLLNVTRDAVVQFKNVVEGARPDDTELRALCERIQSHVDAWMPCGANGCQRRIRLDTGCRTMRPDSVNHLQSCQQVRSRRAAENGGQEVVFLRAQSVDLVDRIGLLVHHDLMQRGLYPRWLPALVPSFK